MFKPADRKPTGSLARPSNAPAKRYRLRYEDATAGRLSRCINLILQGCRLKVAAAKQLLRPADQPPLAAKALDPPRYIIEKASDFAVDRRDDLTAITPGHREGREILTHMCQPVTFAYEADYPSEVCYILIAIVIKYAIVHQFAAEECRRGQHVERR